MLIGLWRAASPVFPFAALFWGTGTGAVACEDESVEDYGNKWYGWYGCPFRPFGVPMLKTPPPVRRSLSALLQHLRSEGVDTVCGERGGGKGAWHGVKV
jgi:hypothetical protein